MDDNMNQFELLLESVADYGVTSYELAKLKTLDKTSDVVSSLVPHAIVFTVLMSFLLFLSLGVAFLLGEIFGNIFYGFFVVASFYGLIGLVLHFLMHGYIKKKISDYVVKHALK